MSEQALAGLRNIPYFAHVPEAALEKLASFGARKSFAKNTVIINEGDEAGALYIIVSGQVQVYLSNDAGRMVTLCTQESGSFFGELSLLDGEPRSASVMTLEPTVCYLIPRSAFQTWLESNVSVSLSIIHSLTRRIRDLTENVRGLALTDVYGRLVKTLGSLSAESNGGWLIENRPSHQELANRVGCSREMISRIMKDLARGGYIQVEGKHLRINRKLPPSW